MQNKENDYCSTSHDCACHSCHEHGESSHESKKLEITCLVISLVLFVTGLLTMRQTGTRVFFTLPLSALFFIGAWFISGFEVLSSAVKNIFHGEVFDENFLMTIASIGAFILGEYLEGAAVMLLYNIGELIQDYAISASRNSITKLIDVQVDTVTVLEGGNEKHIPAETVSIGSIILVKPGEKIPIDGIVESGHALVETASLTGESVPRSLGPGDTVLSGFISLDGALQIKTTTVFSESVASKVSELIENAQDQKANPEKFITRFARLYTPIVTISALCLAVLPPLVLSFVHKTPITGFENFSVWFYRGLIFLTISCPCALVISVPLSYFASIGGLAKKGILVKGANYIDSMANISTCVFDKTGTLTEAKLSISHIECENGFTETEVLQLVYEAEKNSSHPIAKALTEGAKQKCGNLLSQETNEVKNFVEYPGKGVRLEVNGKVLLVGNRKIFEYADAVDHPKKENFKNEKTFVIVIYDNKVAGTVYLSDSLRKSSLNLVDALKAVGVKKTIILTGDSHGQAEQTAQMLSMSHFKAELLPEQKLLELETIIANDRSENKKNRVSFIGDGINDAAALTLADVGISFGNISSDIAIESADVIFLQENLQLLPQLIMHSKKTARVVRQNIIFALAVKMLFLLLGAFGLIGMLLAIFADVGVSLIAVLNSLRARYS